MGDPDEDIGLDLVDHVRLISGLVAKLTGRFDSDLLWKECGRSGALALRDEVKVLTGLVRDLATEADGLLVATMEGERQALIDGHTVTVRRAYLRKWDTPLLAGAVAACVLAGERLPEVDTVVEAFVKAARMEWRVTAIDEMGIDSDRYCTKELGRATVVVQ